MIKGTVKFFNGTKGFGFITPDDGSKEVFVPSATVTASGTSLLKAGQRVSFEAELEARGPKAVKLSLLEEPLREVPLREVPRDPSRELVREAPRPALTLYHETDCEDADDVMEALSAAGYAARQVDYTATPPNREELKRLSVMLRESNQSLARRYEPLFMELQLDDRFISESEFLTAIFEHPTLINGPILVSPGKARICRTAEDVHAFLGNGVEEEKRPKGISARMTAMMLGHAVPPAAPPVVVQETRKAEAPAKIVAVEMPVPVRPVPVRPVPLRPVPTKPETTKTVAVEMPVPARPVPAKIVVAPAKTVVAAEKPAPRPERQPELDLELAPKPTPKVKLIPRAKKAVVVEKAPAKKPVAKVPAKPVKPAKTVKAKAPAKPAKPAKKARK